MGRRTGSVYTCQRRYRHHSRNAPNLYLDFAYNKHPQEPGLYWGGWVNERNTYDLLPYDVYRSVRMGMRGDVMDWDKANHKPDGVRSKNSSLPKAGNT